MKDAFKYLKWVSGRSSRSYFEKQSSKNWIEFQQDRFKAEYVELNQTIDRQNGSPQVILKRSKDGMFFKLIYDSAYYSKDQSRYIPYARGVWSPQTKKSEGSNLKA